MAKERNKLRAFDYTGPIGKLLADFIAEKRAVGFKYSSEAFRLREIDQLCIALNTPPGTLPRNLVEEWGIKRPHESHKTWQSRQVVMRQRFPLFQILMKRRIGRMIPIFYLGSKDSANLLTKATPHKVGAVLP